jgi:hypothetical protein
VNVTATFSSGKVGVETSLTKHLEIQSLELRCPRADIGFEHAIFGLRPVLNARRRCEIGATRNISVQTDTFAYN